ncbi:MAG: DUF3455 domain-containing protein [Solirubrobacteraceae bacterium]
MRLPRAALLLGVAAALAAAAPAAAGPAAPDVPDRIAVPEGHKPFLIAHASGVQRYPCTTVPGGHAWGASTPQAVLTGGNGHVIGDHFGGPSWRTKDGSTVTAARVDGVTVDPAAIPWLLLRRTPVGIGVTDGRLGATTYIQRVATAGGLTPPAADCNALTAGTTREVPYTADYVFWKAHG